jgi:hypothetical protein
MGKSASHFSLEDLRKVLGLEPVKDAEGNVIQEAPLSFWANFRQRALDVCDFGDLQEKGFEDLNRIVGEIKTSARDGCDFFDKRASGTGE